MIGIHAPKQEVDVCESQGASGSVASGAGRCSGAFWTDKKPLLVVSAKRTSTRRYGFNSERRRPKPRRADSMFELVIQLAVVTGDIRASAAHIEGDDAIKAGFPARRRRANNPAGRPAEKSVLRAKGVRRNKPTGACHKMKTALFQRARDSLQITFHHRRQISVAHRSLRSWKNLNHGRQLVRSRDMGKTGPPKAIPQSNLVDGVAPSMKEGNGCRVYSFGPEHPDFALQSGKLDRNEDVSLSVKPFLYFDNHIVERRRFANAKRKEIGPLLVANAQKVLESLSNKEGYPTAFSLQQSVCSLGGGQSHFDGR